MTVFRAAVTWNNELWKPLVPDELSVETFPTARALAHWLLEWGRWLRRIDWIEEAV
jgi:hypothetical protein